MFDRSQRRWAYVLVAVLAIGSPLFALAQDSSPPSAPPPTAPKEGRLHLLLFGSETNVPVAGVRVQVGDLVGVTNENGSVELVLPAGTHAPIITTRLPDGRDVIQQFPPVTITAGEVSQFIATIRPDGTLAGTDIESPDTVAAEEEKSEAPPEETPAGPPGTVRGTIKSLEGGEPVRNARIYVRGSQVEGDTDAQGRFTLELPEGEYTLSIIHPSFSTQTLDAVQVRPSDTTELVVEMTPAGMALDDFIVTAPYIKGSVASLLDTRRESAAATDSIGAEEIGRTPASDAAGAAQRVVGAIIVDGRFIYVRGLGERYSNARLNGLPLPSPEPDRAAVPLDLFPAQIISRLEISKTFTPDLPADFAGGSVLIETIRVPETPIFQLSLSGGWNSQATFREMETHTGGRWDWLGFDDGSRALPDDIPRDYPLRRLASRPDGSQVSNDDLDQYGPRLNTTGMSTKGSKGPPNGGGSILAGKTWKLGGGKKLGLVGSWNYRRRFIHRERTVREFVPTSQPGVLQPWFDGQLDQAEDAVRWGAFSALTLELSPDHTFTFSGFRSQLADKTTEIFEGYNDSNGLTVGSSRLMYASRDLTMGQLQGSHVFKPLASAKLEWNLGISRAARDQPNTRDIVYTASGDTPPFNFAYERSGEAGRRFFAEQHELSRAVGMDWTQPIPNLLHDTKLKVGGLLSWKDREFRARRFYYRPPSRGGDSGPLVCGEQFDPRGCPADLFVDELLDGSVLRLDERTSPADAFDAGLYVYAGYGMIDAALTERWRVIAGSRVEVTDQFVRSVDQFTGAPAETGQAELHVTDWLPAAAIVYSPREDMNLRLAGSRTLARPQLRELAQFAWADFWGAPLISGNPDLTLTRILNGDLRLEWFPTTREVIAASLFVKRFTDPIEPVLKPAGSIMLLTFQNAEGASLYGIELEARKELGFITDVLENFSIGANLTLAASKIRLRQTGSLGEAGDFLTNSDRGMVHQAPYVINLAFDYENESGTLLRLLYNVSGPRILQVGVAGLDDGYLHPVHLLDFIAGQKLSEHFMLRLSVANILNARTMVTQGRARREDRVTLSYREGITAMLTLSAQL